MTTSQVLSEKNSRRSQNLSNTLSTQPVYGIPITKLAHPAKNSGVQLIEDTGFITTHLAGRKMLDMDLDMDLDVERYLFTEFTSIFFSFLLHTVTSHTRSPRHPNNMSGKGTTATKARRGRRGKRKLPDWSVWKRQRVCHICEKVAGQKERFHACNQRCGTLYCDACFTDSVVEICHGCKTRGCVGCINDTECLVCHAQYCSACEERTVLCNGCEETVCFEGDCYNSDTGYCIGCDGEPGPGPDEGYCTSS